MVYCHRPNCYWLSLDNLTDLQGVPPLHPNPEISGIGVILGFSITAYLTLALLILHYLTVYDPCRNVAKGQFYVNEIDRRLLAFVRECVTAWTPTRRFEYAMEKSVLILSDTQVVTGLAILTAGYSQLECGITAYHWQIMVFVSWFSSFTFLAAMTFLEDYFQTNNKLRIIRLFFMFILSSLLVVALLPTGSQNWLDLLNEGGGFYPSLSALCYYQQITMESFTDGGPRLWSMVFSILVVGFSYIHSGIRLFDPRAEFTRRYFRELPGTYLKRTVNFLNHKSKQRGIRAAPWILPLLLAYSTFVIARASYDIAESMLLEIIWLAFAIAWGTIKIWDTRKITGYNAEGNYTGANVEVLDENSWSFGQTLPLVLLLLPLLSMAQAYMDNDAKAQDRLKIVNGEICSEAKGADAACTTGKTDPQALNGTEELAFNGTDSTSCTLTRCNHHPSTCSAQRNRSSNRSASKDYSNIDSIPPPPIPPRSPFRPFSPMDLPFPGVRLPPANQPFTHYAWYKDQILLLLLQALTVTAFALFFLNELANLVGISAILRNHLFLAWVLGFIPAASFVHLSFWFIAAVIVRRLGCEEWLKGTGEQERTGMNTWKSYWQSVTSGKVTYIFLRMLLVCICVVLTILMSLESAGDKPLFDY